MQRRSTDITLAQGQSQGNYKALLGVHCANRKGERPKLKTVSWQDGYYISSSGNLQVILIIS